MAPFMATQIIILTASMLVTESAVLTLDFHLHYLYLTTSICIICISLVFANICFAKWTEKRYGFLFSWSDILCEFIMQYTKNTCNELIWNWLASVNISTLPMFMCFVTWLCQYNIVLWLIWEQNASQTYPFEESTCWHYYIWGNWIWIPS